jgi:peptide deformylase
MKVLLDTRGKDIVEAMNWMQDHSKHPLNKIIPYLHARQIGIEANVIFSMENSAKPSIIINPEFVVRNRKHVKKGLQVSESFLLEGKEHIKRVFLAERSESILLKYSEYTDGDTPMTRGSDEYEGEYAVCLQEATDFSGGRLITRFPEVTDEIAKEEDPDAIDVEGIVVD